MVLTKRLEKNDRRAKTIGALRFTLLSGDFNAVSLGENMVKSMLMQNSRGQ